MKGLTYAFTAMMACGLVASVFTLPKTIQKSPSGAALSRTFSELFPQKSKLVEVAAASRFVTLRGHDDQVRLGQNGWIYLTQELRPQSEKVQHYQEHVQAIAKVHEQLKAKGTTLVVLIVPTKARIYPEHLPALLPTGYLQDGYQEVQNLLQKAGVQTIDALTPLLEAKKSSKEPLYYLSDTHYNPLGAKVVADAAGSKLRTLFPDLPETRFNTTLKANLYERPGDLIGLMSLHHAPAGMRPKGDMQQDEETLAEESLNAGLLGDPTPGVVLTGSSYSLRANFHGRLQQASSTKIINLAREGSGFDGSLRTYLKNPEPYPEVLIWEFSERFLHLPLDEKSPGVARP